MLNRRITLVAAASATATAALAPMAMSAPTSPSVSTQVSTHPFTDLPGLKPSPRMPVVFAGHGSPMNVLEANPWRDGWAAFGRRFGAGGAEVIWPKPQLILCISAHWITRGWEVTGMEKPATIHDFGGFPRALYAMQYPAPGAPHVAEALAAGLVQPHNQLAVQVDEHQWGLDHGSWGVLLPMFPQADIPVIQLSMDYSRPPAEHLALGQQLAALRQRGVLIVASGNIVHNLREMSRTAADNQAFDWAIEFDARTASHLNQGDADGLANFLNWGHVARMAHPTHDHMLPLLYAAGAATTPVGQPVPEPPEFFNLGFQMASVSMRSVVWR